MLQLSPALTLTNLHSNAPIHVLDHAKNLWTDHETKRRILLAAFVLDTQNSVLFQQPLCCPPDLDGVDLPYPQSTAVWDCNDTDTWRKLVSSHQPLALRFVKHNMTSSATVDPFQSSVLSCYQIQRRFAGPNSTAVQNERIRFYVPETHYASAYLTHHALQLCAFTPLESLLIVSSGSWLFGTKITENSVWSSAKTALRVWVSTEDAARCVWHAIQALRIVLRGGSVYLLHEQWCIYLAALVCWAYGFVPRHPSRAVPDAIPVGVAETQTWEYLHAMNVSIWKEISRVPLRWSTRGLLECVRAKISGKTGGLLNQAEAVLARLVEGKSQLMDF